jgi:S-layer protein (TIGR01567 family)
MGQRESRLYALGRDVEADYVLARAEILANLSNDQPDLVEAAFIRGHFSNGNGIWLADDFGWFYYNLDEDLGGEELKIDMQGRTAEKGHIIYSSKTWMQQFKYEPWGCFYEVAFWGNAYLAGYPKSSFTKELSSMERGELRSVLMNDDTPQTIKYNKTLILQQGYVLVPQKISKKNCTVDFLLLKNGVPVYASMVSIGESFVYKVNDTPVILIHLADVIQRGIEELAKVDGIFQISDDPDIKLFEGALDGNMKLDTLSKECMVFCNNISLAPRYLLCVAG